MSCIETTNVPEQFKCKACFKVYDDPLKLSCGQHAMCLLCVRAAAQGQHAKTDVSVTEGRIEKSAAETLSKVDESIPGERIPFPCPHCAAQVPSDLTSDTLGLTADEKIVAEIEEWKLKAHRVVPADSVREVRCGTHPDQVVTMCCAKDEVPVCTQCVSEGAHPSNGEHPLCSIDELVTTVTARITAGIAQCAAQCDAVTAARDTVSAAIETLNKSYTSACTSVNTHIDDIIARLNGVRAEKLAEVKLLWRCQHDLLESQVGVLGSAKAYMNETIGTARRVVEGRCTSGVDSVEQIHTLHSILTRLVDATSLCRDGLVSVCGDRVWIEAKDSSDVAEQVSDAIPMQGDCNVMRRIGNLLCAGDVLAKDYDKAMEWYMKAAERGDSIAQYNIGLRYDNGEGATQDYGKAMEWYMKAAAGGDDGAMFNLGVLFANGDGVTQDYSKAMEWYMKAAECGDSGAMFNIGVLYHNGHGVTQDYGKAMEWYMKAAEGGHTGALFNAGVLFDNGCGVTRDYIKAIEWWMKAAEGGNALAQYSIGVMYEFGRGVPWDTAKAIEWFTKAAQQGHKDAQERLAALRTQ